MLHDLATLHSDAPRFTGMLHATWRAMRRVFSASTRRTTEIVLALSAPQAGLALLAECCEAGEVLVLSHVAMNHDIDYLADYVCKDTKNNEFHCFTP